ncbi:MAG: radical SAM protein [Nitrosopumilaceae archaeon]|nr:radical SAM protein [Nitrosopumilaceae archaeon]NIU00535.1 radical SAM protein [Nitrosopumilaceae archaeon]NIU86924.1 radical SAM protein [Nitrosopumilaceae archaeon]NIV65595.1 radical SAM protein [Nitrosopumilaceae archaeon]NIX61137.1 radical SAM protein [Nitrosopumilaceae archaeon]
MEIMGRGPVQIARETPAYLHLFKKYLGYKLFNKRSPFYGSADIINVCNLHCEHCYWWLNRKEDQDLSLDDWKKIIDEKFKKNHVFIVTVVGGEPLMRKDVVELFAKEFPKRACVVTNGTYPIPHLDGIYFYWVSIDGDKQTHNEIRGEGAWEKTRKNVIDYVNSSDKAWKDIWITMTINSKNYKTIPQVLDDWKDYSNKIGVQFHTPFVDGDPLWLPFGKERNQVIDYLLERQATDLKDYIINPTEQLEIMKTSWGGKGTTPIDCPTWAIISVDHKGREKLPCCIGSAEKDGMKPNCEKCGLGCYSVLMGYGMKG